MFFFPGFYAFPPACWPVAFGWAAIAVFYRLLEQGWQLIKKPLLRVVQIIYPLRPCQPDVVGVLQRPSSGPAVFFSFFFRGQLVHFPDNLPKPLAIKGYGKRTLESVYYFINQLFC